MKIISSALLIVALLTLSACSSKQADAPKNTEVTAATDAKAQTKTEEKTPSTNKTEGASQPDAKGSVKNPLDLSSYASVAQFEATYGSIEHGSQKIMFALKENDITLTATVSHKLPDSRDTLKYIDSLVVTKGNQKFTLPTERKPATRQGKPVDVHFLSIASMALSPSQTWLAVHISQNPGNVEPRSKDIVVFLNLKTGKSIILNDLLESEGRADIEGIDQYNWSPTADEFAFSYDDKSDTSLAMYAPETDSFVKLTKLAKTADHIILHHILWNKDGRFINYIIQNRNNEYILYRYSLDSKQVETVSKITWNDIVKMSSLDKIKSNR